MTAPELLERLRTRGLDMLADGRVVLSSNADRENRRMAVATYAARRSYLAPAEQMAFDALRPEMQAIMREEAERAAATVHPPQPPVEPPPPVPTDPVPFDPSGFEADKDVPRPPRTAAVSSATVAPGRAGASSPPAPRSADPVCDGRQAAMSVETPLAHDVGPGGAQGARVGPGAVATSPKGSTRRPGAHNGIWPSREPMQAPAEPQSDHCRVCDAPLSDKKQRRHSVYCSRACQQSAYRERHPEGKPSRSRKCTAPRDGVTDMVQATPAPEPERAEPVTFEEADGGVTAEDIEEAALIQSGDFDALAALLLADEDEVA